MQQFSFSTQNPQYVVYLLFAFSFRKSAELTSGNELVLQEAGSITRLFPILYLQVSTGLLTAHSSRAEPLVVSYSKTVQDLLDKRQLHIIFEPKSLGQIQNLIQFIPLFSLSDNC